MQRLTTILNQYRLPIIRVIWIVLAALTLIVMIAAAGPRYENLTTVHTEKSGIGDLTPDDVAALHALGLSLNFYAILLTTLELMLAAAFFTVATVIFFARPGDFAATLIALTLVTFGANGSPILDAVIALRPGWAAPAGFLRVIGLTGMVFVFYIFPDGRFVPRWLRWFALLWLGYVALWPVSTQINPMVRIVVTGPAEIWNLLVLVIFMVVSMASQLYRYFYVSTPLQKRQTQWVVYGSIVALSVASIVSLPVVLNRSPVPGDPAYMLLQIVVFTIVLLVQMGMAATVGISILRYRLYDIDIIVRRTLIYSLVTAMLGLTYFGLVIGTQSLFGIIMGESSALALVISTLAIAALFNPLRQRVQQFVDRRFYRSRYSTQKALEDFNIRLRDEVDIDTMLNTLAVTVQNTLQPETMSIWLNSAKKVDKSKRF